MSAFDQSKSRPGDEQLLAMERWNLMWDLWVAGRVPSPVQELMSYLSEINNGGHDQFFTNTENCGDLHAAMEALLTILPAPLDSNLRLAFSAYLAEDDETEAECDMVYYRNEETVNALLQAYADTLTL